MDIFIISLSLLSPSQSLPEFGPYLAEKEHYIADYKKTVVPVEEFAPEVQRPAYRPSRPVPTVKVSITTHTHLHLHIRL